MVGRRNAARPPDRGRSGRGGGGCDGVRIYSLRTPSCGIRATPCPRLVSVHNLPCSRKLDCAQVSLSARMGADEPSERKRSCAKALIAHGARPWCLPSPCHQSPPIGPLRCCWRCCCCGGPPELLCTAPPTDSPDRAYAQLGHKYLYYLAPCMAPCSPRIRIRTTLSPYKGRRHPQIASPSTQRRSLPASLLSSPLLVAIPQSLRRVIYAKLSSTAVRFNHGHRKERPGERFD